MLLIVGLLALTLPVFASAWLLSGSFRGAVRGWVEYCGPLAALIVIGGVVGALWAGLESLT